MPDTLTAVKTPVKITELAAAFREAGLSIEAAELAVAHSALETGWWKECWNWNLGNAKATSYEPHVFRPCGEELPASQVDRADTRLQVVKEYERKGVPYLSVNFLPNHPMTRFKAYDSLAAAVQAHVNMLKSKFPKSWIALSNASPKGFGSSLAAEGYYTANPDTYTASLVSVLKDVKSKAVWWTYSPDLTLSERDRVVACAKSLLDGGPVAEDRRAHVYRSFINCEMRPAGVFMGQPIYDLSGVHTSCGIFVRAILYWSGRETKLAKIAGPITDYVQADFASPSWKKAGKPEPGDVFFTPKYGGHVGLFLEELSPGLWRTAEGGGGSGTLCQFAQRRLDTVQGWWSLTGLGLPKALTKIQPASEVPATGPESKPPPPEPFWQDLSKPEQPQGDQGPQSYEHTSAPPEPESTASKKDGSPYTLLLLLGSFLLASLMAALRYCGE
jgi:hypothetical protein